MWKIFSVKNVYAASNVSVDALQSVASGSAINPKPGADGDTAIQGRIDDMLDKLGVKDGEKVYFTVNQSACAKWRKNGHGCSKCDVENVVEATWFKEIFGDVKTKLFPPHAGAGYMETNTGRSCFGFACFAQWYIYADSNEEKIDAERVAVVKFNKDNMFQNVKPGDVLRIDNSHSMLVYSVEEEGIVVVDSNWNIGGQLNCLVQKHMLKYDSSYKNDVTCVYRAVKSDEPLKADEPVMEWVQTEDGIWYYMDYKKGIMAKGWMQAESGLWYYLDPDEGYMLSDCWLCDPDSGRWYYLDPNGAMCTSWIIVDDIWYYLDANGAMCTGWNIINDKWYLFHINGSMLTGWQEVGGKLYYMTENGDCLINTTTPDGYRVDENGARID
ncbi:MAG: N-acetylmuramoyl-L-alanine amidase family protein, partial [Lachnospiraceae bacterium]|nr:N-acetylmuramoyl-L-alanine amidase family protein [Lachnospiraceae bacterium]